MGRNEVEKILQKLFKILILISFFQLFRCNLFALDLKKLSGSDLGMGIGARAIGLSGAFVGLSDDMSAVFWNPAGLLQIDGSQFSIMIDPPNQISFKAVALKLDKKDFVIGYSIINRLRYKGEGNWGDSFYTQHLIDLSMINVEKTYDGGIDSTTIDKRITIAGKFNVSSECLWGVNFVDFKCVTTFYGKGAGRTCQVVAYKTIDAGLLYKINNNSKIGITFKNVIEPSKPRDVTIGYSTLIKNLIFTVDSENIFGKYDANNRRTAKFWFIRSGVEKKINTNIAVRGGIVIPLVAWTESIGNLRKNLPNPKFGGSFGFSYNLKNYLIDFALFGNPGKSYIEHKPVLSYTLSLTGKF